MRPECSYVKPDDGFYVHPFYCRAGILDEVTVNVIHRIIQDVVELNGTLDQANFARINIQLNNIVYQGLPAMLHIAITQMLDSIRPDEVWDRHTIVNYLNNLIQVVEQTFISSPNYVAIGLINLDDDVMYS
jgi:hypothetical protein